MTAIKGSKQSRKKQKASASTDENLATLNESAVCLIRATDGKARLSTTANEDSAENFGKLLTNVLRINIDNLKKKEKKRRGSTSKKLVPSPPVSSQPQSTLSAQPSSTQSQ
eukprot:GHVU01166882.1.p3 GENE.GHVU01166882.1~~GHVU01166882.1.p3  ORF type:complete len:111 (+),score=19.20 GHVU01166882.1:348-680(+)